MEKTVIQNGLLRPFSPDFFDGLKRPFLLDFGMVLKSNFYVILYGLKREVALYRESVLMFWLSLSLVEFQYQSFEQKPK